MAKSLLIATVLLISPTHITICMMKRNDTLDALRGIAALMVFVTHTTNAIGGAADILQYRYFSPGIFGVVLFFGISGTVIPKAFKRAPDTFLYRRLWRIMPAYLVGLGAAALIVQPPLLSILAHLTMLPDLFGQTRINGVYWSLEIELLFYLLIAAGWCGHPLPWLILSFFTGWIAPLGIATIGCAMQKRRNRTWFLILLTSLCWLVVPPNTFVGVKVAAALAVPTYALVREVRLPRLLHWLGDISFGIYLLHMPVIWAVKNPLLWLPATIILAWFLHILAERPALRAAQKVCRRGERERIRDTPSVADLGRGLE